MVDILGTLDKKIEFYDTEKTLYIKLGKCLYKDIINRATDSIAFENIFSFINGYAFKSNNYISNGSHKVITIKNITETGFSANSVDTLDFISDYNKAQLNIGDILLTMTGEVGRCGIVDQENCLLNQRVLKVSSFSAFFTYFTLLNYSENIKSLAKGSVQQNLGVKELSKFIIPIGNKLEYLENDYIIEKLITIAQEQRKLRELKRLYLQKFFG